MGLREKIIGSIVLICLITVCLVSYSAYTLQHQNSDGKVINIAGRQRMLCQKMSKESFVIANYGLNAELSENLTATVDEFDTALTDLINGNTARVIPAPAESAIITQLGIVQELWMSFKPNILALTQEKSDSEEFQNSLKYVKDNNIALLKNLNKAVGLFELSSREKIDYLMFVLFAGGSIILIVSILASLVINYKVIKPLKSVSDMILELDNGNLDVRLNMKSRSDEIGHMAKSVDSFAENMQNEIIKAFDSLGNGDLTFAAKGIIKEPLKKVNVEMSKLLCSIISSATNVAQGSGELAGASESLAQGSTEQAATLQEISSSINSIDERTQSDAKNAQKVEHISANAYKSAEKGNASMQEMLSAMEDIHTSSEEIGRIIKTIDDIAFQTNLLALNAAVEAARAGIHGKGFAVVAEEVRNLANRSAKAASETSHLIEGAVNKIKRGMDISNNTAEALEQIKVEVTQVRDVVSDIADSTTAQARGISEVNVGLTQLDEVTQVNATISEKTASASSLLATKAGQQVEKINTFKIIACETIDYEKDIEKLDFSKENILLLSQTK